MTNCSGIIEKGHGSIFELHHTLQCCKTANRIILPIYDLNFRFLAKTNGSRDIKRAWQYF